MVFGKLPKKASHNDSDGEKGNNSYYDPNGMYEVLPRFKDVPESEKPNLFVGKLRACCVVLDLNDPSKHLKEKEIKRKTLVELVDYVTSVKVTFDDVAMQALTEMVAVNLFRTFPSVNHENDEEPSLDPAWPHIQPVYEEHWLEPAWPHIHIVYELLLGFLVSPKTDTNLAERYIDHSFILKLLDLFYSDYHSGRQDLKTILRQVYEMFMVHRPYIIQAINDFVDRFTSEETERNNNGIFELLEILVIIIKGFALPLKEEHTLLLERALIPLHKPKCVSVIYHEKLSYCILEFVEKDFKLADTVITGLVEYWPMNDSSKEVMFLDELKKVLKATKAAEFQRCMVPLFKQIARCLNSSNFQVAKTAVFLWNNDHIRNLITQNYEVIMPIVFTALEKDSHGYLNQAVLCLTHDARKVFNNIAGIAAVSIDETVERNSPGHLDQAVQSLTQDTGKVFRDIAGIVVSIDKSVEKNSHGKLNQSAQSLTQYAKKVFSDIAGIAAISVSQSVEFTLEELADATSNFDLSFKIGQGGFGVVYYAELRGKKAAIKKMNVEASKEFLAELKVLTHVHHVNLVHLIGYCVKGSLFLVYEYVENGNLEQHLHGLGQDPLPWTKRVQIALDSARGLEYIHEHAVSTYVHRDIKSANILIDQRFRAKVADFGLTKLVVDEGSLTRPMGTIGYMAPEIVNGEVSAKVDVYAFGVVLYQLISAKRAIVRSKKSGAESKALVTVFEEEVFKASGKEKAIRKIIDPRLGNDYPFDSVYKMAELGRACTQQDPQLRPSMSKIVFALSPDNVPNVRNYDLFSFMFRR